MKKRISLILWLLFDYRKFECFLGRNIRTLLNKTTDKINYLKQQQKEKIRYLEYENVKKGILKSDYKNDIIEFPIELDNSNYKQLLNLAGFIDSAEHTVDFKREIYDVQRYFVSFLNHEECPIEYIENEAAMAISKKLIENNYLKAEFRNQNKVVFYINLF